MDGVLIINKPAGMTSHDVINCLRRKYHQKKFGHTGTLDPEATGVLVVLAGKAAKCLQFLEDTDKEYIAQIELGTDTDTDDAGGQVIETRPVCGAFDFAAELNKFLGVQRQKVPAASAKKINGKKLLDLQRQGKEVPDVYQDIVIYEIKPVCEKDLTFKIKCSSGTYVRSVCRDLAHNTGNAGHMKSLVRTLASGFTIEQAEELEAQSHTVYPIRSLFPSLETVVLSDLSDVRNGKPLRIPDKPDRILILDEQGDIQAVYDRKENDLYTCTRGLWA